MKSTIDRLFVDMDGVINKFSSYALTYVGALDHMKDYRDYPLECQTWDIIRSANHLRQADSPLYTPNSFWSALDIDFWATIPPEYYLGEMIEFLVKRIGTSNICVASTPTLCPSSVSGKLMWIKKEMPSFMWRQYMLGRDKFLLAKSGTLLIDDNQDNCLKFEQAGGKSILFPRPWNNLRQYLNDDSGWGYVKSRLEFYFGV